MREGKFNTAASFAAQLKSRSSGFVGAVVKAVSTTAVPDPVTDGVVSATRVAATAAAAEAVNTVDRSDMMALLEGLRALFENWTMFGRKLLRKPGLPSIIIDEANRLHEWNLSDEEQMNLATLQAFFIMLTKEAKIANVILATSDDFFRVWVNSRIGHERYKVAVVGDLVEQEARSFLCQEAAAYFPDDLWEDIYGFVGGRMMLLKDVAETLSASSGEVSMMTARWLSWKHLLEERSFREVAAAYDPATLPRKRSSAAPLWTAADYLAVLQKITRAEGGVVSEDELLRGRVLSKEALYSLIQHNFLHLRDVGLWAKDLSWYKGHWPVVMPLSKPRYHAMKRVVAHYSETGGTEESAQPLENYCSLMAQPSKMQNASGNWRELVRAAGDGGGQASLGLVMKYRCRPHYVHPTDLI